jgi:beta-galactosidase
MQNLLSDTYFPFGSQYYRAPSPPESDWERDLSSFARHGFNTIKFWVQWRWNNPDEGRYYFDDIDRLMELASRNKLRVMLNTIFDVAPAWIYKKYPDASMVTLSGRRIGPQTQPHRQIGGLGYCFNHDGIREHFFAFLRETIRRYADHPALEIWNVGSEPELTSSMAEMRLYADNAEKMGDMLCYCHTCENKFKRWLAEKYIDIDSLNRSWNRNYSTFDDVELPKTRNTFNDVIDWRMFFVHTLGENVRRRFETAKEVDNGRHPLMCHHVFIQGFPVTSTASDPWNVGRFGDLHGFTQMDDPMMCDILRSCAKDKPVISAEMLMLMGYTLDLPKPIDMNDIKRNVFTGIAANLKGFIFWQYRPELLGREAPTWGLTYLDGSETPWLKSFSEVGRVLQKHAGFLCNAEPRKAEVALLYSPENQIFAWASTGNEKNATDSLLGYHKALYERNINVDFIHPVEFGENILDRYRVLIVPFPYVLNAEIAERIHKWVREGGVLIGECYFGGWDRENGAHHTAVPGYGLHELFGVRQSIVAPSDPDNPVTIEPSALLPAQEQIGTVRGSIVGETYFVDNADILATYASGEPAVTAASFGKGKAILIGSYIGMPYYRFGYRENGRLIGSLVEYAVQLERPVVSGESAARIDVLTSPDGRVLLIIRNLVDEERSIRFSLKGVRPGNLEEQFSAEILRLGQEGERVTGTVRLAPNEVKVFYA